MLSFVLWDVSPELFKAEIFGFHLEPRWYGLFFALGFLIGQQIMFHIFKKEGKPAQDVETLTVYMVLATVIGARLGHVLFYEPENYFKSPADMLRILKIWEGGLASHGAAIAILFTFWLYTRKKKHEGQTYLWLADRIVIIVALCGCLIRLGNLMNSEIIGKPTNVAWAFVFAGPAREAVLNRYPEQIASVRTTRDDPKKDTVVNGQTLMPLLVRATVQKEFASNDVVSFARRDLPGSLQQSPSVREHFAFITNPNPTVSTEKNETAAAISTYGIPRHPSQLYEAISCLLLFFLLFALWNRYRARTPQGLLLGLFLVVCFGLRFVYEYLKEPQVDFENDLPLYMGQWLSIPAVLGGIAILYIASRNAKRMKASDQVQKA